MIDRLHPDKPLCVDLYCGLGGWTEAFLAEGYECHGYDIEAHNYGTGGYPGILHIRDVRSIHGSDFKDAAIIVGSSPCQEFSYRAMPWKRAKALPPPYLGMELFNAQFRIQREASEAAGRHIPMVVENVRGAQKWVGRAQYHYGSFYLWGDVPALMPFVQSRKMKTTGPLDAKQSESFNCHINEMRDHLKVGNASANQRPEGLKGPGGDWFKDGRQGQDACVDGLKQAGISGLRENGKSFSRKAASAMIAKIPFPLAQHIARTFKP